MIRSTIFLLSLSLLLPACSGPIETRIETQMVSPLSQNKKYSFSKKPEQSNALYQIAKEQVAGILNSKDLNQSQDGGLLVQMSIAERPASIGIATGENDTARDVKIPKENKFLQSCRDMEHIFSIALIDQSRGNLVYRGKAAEYHCKGLIEESLPVLVKQALSDFGKSPMANPKTTIRHHSGID